MAARSWTVGDIPSQRGRVVLVTGPGGLGYETALALAGAGAEVVLAGRDAGKGGAAVEKIRAQVPAAAISFEPLDLASLRSVRAFAARFCAAQESLDILINNAGVMAPPQRRVTEDGFELQFGTNHLGHFALTGLLGPLLRQSSAPRVVQVSSLAHRTGGMNFDDLQSERAYLPKHVYGQSKLANLLFAFELQRRSDAAGWGWMSNAAHPGYARTALIPNGPGLGSPFRRFVRAFLEPTTSHSAAAGALPTLFAATSPDARGAAYYGPQGWHELNGPPGRAIIAPQARDEAAAGRLWEVSERLTGVSWPV